MKNNLPTNPDLPKITAAEAMSKPGLYFVTSEAGHAQIPDGTVVPMVCIMLIDARGQVLICNPTQAITLAQMAPGLVFHGPVIPPI